MVAHIRFGSKADIQRRPSDVRFTPKSGHRLSVSACPCQKRTHALQQNLRYSLALSGREQLRWNFEAECFARPQLNQGLAWSVAETVAVCSVHSPGPGLARMVAAMAASCSEHFPGLELA